VSRESRARRQPHGLHYRQPEREKRGKRGSCVDRHGFDAGKLIKGKKRHVLVDTQGLLLHGIVTAADVQDRDGGRALLATLFGLLPFLRKLFADSAYQGPIFHGALAGILPQIETEIVKRSDQAKGFVVLPKRWIVTARTMLQECALSGQRRSSAVRGEASLGTIGALTG
jgi:transposase